MSLTVEQVGALIAASEVGTVRLVRVVEQIVADALNEAARQIETGPVRRGHNVSVICRCLRCEVAAEAADIVRTAASP